MGRLLQFIALMFVVRHIFRALSRWLGGVERQQVGGRSPGDGLAKPIYRGQMVRDPVCGVFVPQDRAIEERKDGEVQYFCSENCRQAFQVSAT
jgi:YHS domain-containing protein